MTRYEMQMLQNAGINIPEWLCDDLLGKQKVINMKQPQRQIGSEEPIWNAFYSEYPIRHNIYRCAPVDWFDSAYPYNDLSWDSIDGPDYQRDRTKEEFRVHILNLFEAAGSDGKYRVNPFDDIFVFDFPSFLFEETCGSFTDQVFGRKCDNNGTTFIASRFQLRHLSDDLIIKQGNVENGEPGWIRGGA